MLVTDALSVRFLSETKVLAGIGNQLQYFRAEEEVTIKEICPTRTKYKISQITFARSRSGEVKVVASAGPELLFTVISDNTFKKTFLVKLNDWINCVHFDATTNDTVFCVTAHNRASDILADFDHQKATVQKRSRCPEVSTAYSSLIYGHTWNSLLLFAGTAFGELIIWRPDDSTDTGTILLRVPQSHNGVIFDIQLDKEASLLTTCSDDRSIQLWRFKKDTQVPSLEKIKRCFAHVSRVFRSKIIKNGERFYILSVGEDSHVCLWDHLGSLVYKKFLEECGTIWGLDYCKETKTVVVATNNGRLVKIPLENVLEGVSTRTDIIGSSIAKLRYMSGLLICLTGRNIIEAYDVGDVSKVKTSLQLETSEKFCLMETYKGFLYLVTTESKIIAYEYLPDLEKFELRNKETISWGSESISQRSMIRALIPLSAESLLICSNNGLTYALDTRSLQKTAEFRIPKSSEPWITSALETNSGFLVGDRCGHLHLYKIGQMDPMHSLRRLHGNMGITQIMKIDDKTFRTTGHDGTVKTIVLEEDTLRQTFTQKIAAINFIERCTGQFTFGFSSSYFVCLHDKDGILIEHNCGGGNRQYDLFLDNLERTGTFSLAVIQQRKVKQVTFKVKLSQESFLQFPDVRWHHMSCNCLTLAQYQTLLITGGEDTFLKFYSINTTKDKNSQLKLLKTSTQHNSAIKSIITTRFEPKRDLLVISVGSRAKICITRVRFLAKSLSIEEETQFMLYEHKLTQGKEAISFDPESSFTSVTLVKSHQKDILVCGCSDGHFRLFQISLRTNPVKISLETEIFYGRSILHVTSVVWNDFTLVLSMATDGLINFWNFGAMSEGSLFQLKHHDSGIHAFDVRQEGSELLIATGGDDQALVVSKILLTVREEKLLFDAQKTFRIPDLHTAQVTGVRFLSESVLLTLGVDQMVYEVVLDENWETKKLEQALWTSVEDGKGLMWFKGKAMVYGNGIEVL